MSEDATMYDTVLSAKAQRRKRERPTSVSDESPSKTPKDPKKTKRDKGKKKDKPIVVAGSGLPRPSGSFLVEGETSATSEVNTPVGETTQNNPFDDDLHVTPKFIPLDQSDDEMQEADFVFIQRNLGDVVLNTKKPAQKMKSRFLERVTGPRIIFSNSQEIWGLWYLELKNQKKSDAEALVEIKSVIMRKFGVLATASGERVAARMGVIRATVGTILTASPPTISEIPHNTKWVMVECVNEKQRNDLLATMIAFNPTEGAFVTFRKPLLTQNKYRALEIKGIGNSEHWEKTKERLEKEGAMVKETVPKAYDPAYSERVIWWISFERPEYAHPETIMIDDGLNTKKQIKVVNAPNCMVCAATGHHHAKCFYGQDKRVVIEKNRFRKEKAGPVNT